MQMMKRPKAEVEAEVEAGAEGELEAKTGAIAVARGERFSANATDGERFSANATEPNAKMKSSKECLGWIDCPTPLANPPRC